MLQKIFTKRNILTALFVIVYFFVMIRSIWGGYNTVGLLGATLGGHIVIVFLLTLLAIERQDMFSNKYFQGIILAITVLFSLLACRQGWWKGLGIIARNTAYILYAFATRTVLINQKKISLRSLSISGLSLLSALLSIGYVMVFLSYTKPFDIDCNNLKQQTIGILNQYIPSSTNSGNNIIGMISTTIEQFGNKTLGQIVGVGSSDGISDIVLVDSLLSGNTVQSGLIIQSGFIVPSGTLLGKLELYKKNLLDDFLANKSIIDQGVCDFTLAHIQKITANSTFQISAVILLTLLILVFINALFIVIGVVIFILLFILYEIKAYIITTDMQKCEKLK